MLHYGIYCHELKLPISIKVKISLQKDFEDCKPQLQYAKKYAAQLVKEANKL